MKKLLLLICTSMLITMSGCVKARDTKVVSTHVCQSSDVNKIGTVWSFSVNSDGELIKAKLETHVSKKYIKTLYPNADVADIYFQFKNTFLTEYESVQPHQETKPWFKAEINGNDAKYTIDTSYTFDFADEFFDYELNKEFLAIFGLHQFYNQEEYRLLYDETIALHFFSTESEASCTN